ncbi:MAG: hypothetical protein HYY16_01160 [Planctomycetes bacterium]|nr:hypothetical protein [Planctomycetota bacterium]
MRARTDGGANGDDYEVAYVRVARGLLNETRLLSAVLTALCLTALVEGTSAWAITGDSPARIYETR